VTQKGWTLRRLELQRRKLEDAFFDVLRAANPLQGGHAIKPSAGEHVQDLAGKSG
jgi:hypothetical protein